MNKLQLYIIVFLFLPIIGFGQDYLFNTRDLSVENNLLGRRITGIVQDNDGFIWIATNEGLNRFDGYQFEHLTKESHGLNNNYLSNLAIDDVGDIWITYSNDNFIFSPTQIIRPQSQQVLSLKEKLGNQYKPEMANLKMTNYSKNGFITLYNKQRFIYKDNKISSFPNQSTYFNPVNNELWTITTNSMIYKIDKNGKKIKKLDFDKQHERFQIRFTPKGSMFILGVDGNRQNQQTTLYYKNQTSKNFKTITTAKDIKLLDGGCWVNGVLYFEYNNEILTYQSAFFANIMPRQIFLDNQNNLWLVKENAISIISIKPRKFKHYFKDAAENKLNNANYNARGIWANNTYLYSFSPNGVYRYHFDNEQIEPFITELSDVPILSVEESKKGNFWVGTKRRVLLNVDKQTGKVVSKYHGGESQFWSIFEDKNDRVWIGQVLGGLLYVDPNKMTELSTYNNIKGYEEIKDGIIIHIAEDKRNNNYLWIACQSGWYRLHIDKGIQGRYWSESEKKLNIPTVDVYYTYQDKDGIYWLATAQSGLLKVELNEKFEVQSTEKFTIKNGLTSNTIYGIFEDDNNFLWLSTNNGISRFNKTTKEVNVFLEEEGLPHYEFNRLSYFQRSDGTIFFGTLNGIVSFHPKDFIKTSTYDVPLMISKCEKYSDKTETIVNFTDEVLADNQIIIAPNDRFATIQVSLQNYATILKSKYFYRVKGLQEEFTQLNDNKISISGLPYGKYTLEIKVKAQDGRFSTQMISIPLIVKSPFYLKWWFILLVIIGLALAIWQLFQARTRTLQERKQELEEVVKDRTTQLQQQATQLEKDKNIIEAQANELRSLDEMKSRFFANISHELRTPLTLILSPIQSIIKRQKTDNRDFTSAKIVEQNAQKLLKRINEILDLTKLEANEMELKPQPTPFYNFLKRLTAVFESLAAQKEQYLAFDYQLDKELNLLLDQDKYEHIFNNYLSNAIKFTPKGGTINIQLFEKQVKNGIGKIENRIVLSVSDDGQGIPNTDLEKVFDRFFQSNHNQNKSGSSGIGLALVKEISTLMNGTVHVESEIGKGSTFFFEMPFIEELGMRNEKLEIQSTNGTTLLNFESLVKLNSTQQANKPTVLLVEDNTQLRNYIQLILQEKYNVITAENGKEALEQLKPSSEASVNRQPSAIISDIMMPEMNGFELLEQLKSSDDWRHIPVVMLTARSNVKDKLKALRIGVDDYILKPFQEEELLARIDNLIKNVAERTIINKVETEKSNDKTSQSTLKNISASDMKWLEKVEKIIQSEISNSKFTVDTLSDILNASRSKVHRRIKLITGLTPNKYFREIKLQAAREILEKGDAQTVNEVCYAVGFDTPKYFSKIYEQRFGRRPISYIRSM